MRGQLGVQVFGEHELLDRILKEEKVYSHCISIRSPDQEMPEILPPAFAEVLELKFYDVESEDQLPTQQDKRAPRLTDAKRVVEFVKRTMGGDLAHDPLLERPPKVDRRRHLDEKRTGTDTSHGATVGAPRYN